MPLHNMSVLSMLIFYCYAHYCNCYYSMRSDPALGDRRLYRKVVSELNVIWLSPFYMYVRAYAAQECVHVVLVRWSGLVCVLYPTFKAFAALWTFRRKRMVCACRSQYTVRPNHIRFLWNVRSEAKSTVQYSCSSDRSDCIRQLAHYTSVHT
jgi:hypothetical protein